MNGILAWLAIAPVATAAAAFPEPKMPTYFESPMNFDVLDGLRRIRCVVEDVHYDSPASDAAAEFQYATTAATACRSLWPTSCVGPVSGASMPK